MIPAALAVTVGIRCERECDGVTRERRREKDDREGEARLVRGVDVRAACPPAVRERDRRRPVGSDDRARARSALTTRPVVQRGVTAYVQRPVGSPDSVQLSGSAAPERTPVHVPPGAIGVPGSASAYRVTEYPPDVSCPSNEPFTLDCAQLTVAVRPASDMDGVAAVGSAPATRDRSRRGSIPRSSRRRRFRRPRRPRGDRAIVRRRRLRTRFTTALPRRCSPRRTWRPCRRPDSSAGRASSPWESLRPVREASRSSAPARRRDRSARGVRLGDRRFAGPSHPACELPGRTVTVSDVTRIAKSNGFETVSGAPARPGAESIREVAGDRERAGWLRHARRREHRPGDACLGSDDTAPVHCANAEEMCSRRRGRRTWRARARRPCPAVEPALGTSPSATEKANAASVEVVLPSGCDEIVGARRCRARRDRPGESVDAAPTTGAASARSRKTCRPSPRPRYVRGPTHDRQRALSSRHSGLVFGFSSHANVAFLETHGRTGTVVKVGRSRLPFAASLPARSDDRPRVRRWRNSLHPPACERERGTCAPTGSAPPIVIGLGHAVYTASSTAHSYVSPGSRSNANVARVEMAGLIGALEMRGAAGAASAPNAPRPT